MSTTRTLGQDERSSPRRSLLGGILLTAMLVVVGGSMLNSLYAQLVSVIDHELRLRSLIGTIIHLDEVLTMSASMAASTGEVRWEARYREHEPKLFAAIDATIALAPDAYANASASQTSAASLKLLEMENAVFAHVRAGRSDEARATLLSAEYDRQKSIYARGMSETLERLEERAGTVLERQRARLGAAALGALALLVAICLVWVRIGVLVRRYINAATDAERMLAAANQALEQRIEQRTADLANANRALTAQMAERALIDVELRHAQKLEAVGRLASGIAHEINTPIQFVSDNVTFLASAFTKVVGVVRAQRAWRRALDDGDAAALPRLDDELRVAGASADIDDLFEQIPAALSESEAGLERVASLVRSMKDFAHPEQHGTTAADINQALACTLTMARNEHKYVADIETDFGELPLVPCEINELNQAFLILIINAAHAIADAGDERGKIRVTTRATDGSVSISVADTGCGIPQEIREKVFEPFFTTKSVGRGTGQGLAIARSIVVDKHGGALTFASEVGRGSTFCLVLPAKSLAT